MNLIVNAAHAIAERGTITLVTRAVDDDWVCVEISDTGSGMSEEVKRRIFEPFFTTKPVGQGTGLGLSLSFSIVQKHGGRIEVDSEIGVGTRFKVWIPVQPPQG
jgi:signal transduction histidine kinase